MARRPARHGTSSTAPTSTSTRSSPARSGGQYGTAILSRFPIRAWSNTYLPKFGDHEQRGLLEATIKVRGVTVRFANTHLQHNDNLEREAQAAKIVELLGAEPRRTFLVGDLNATAETPEITTLTNVFTDAWTKVGEGDGFSYPSEDPRRPDRLRTRLPRRHTAPGEGRTDGRVRSPTRRRRRRSAPLTRLGHWEGRPRVVRDIRA